MLVPGVGGSEVGSMALDGEFGLRRFDQRYRLGVTIFEVP